MPTAPVNHRPINASRADIKATAESLRQLIARAARSGGKPNKITEAEINAAPGTPAERAALKQLWRAVDYEPHKTERPAREMIRAVNAFEQVLNDATVKLGGPQQLTEGELKLEIAQLKNTVITFGPAQAKAMVMMAQLASSR